MTTLPFLKSGYNICLCHIPLFSKELLEDEPKADRADEQAERFELWLQFFDYISARLTEATWRANARPTTSSVSTVSAVM